MTITRNVLLGCRAREYLSSGGQGAFIGVFSSSFYCRIEGRGILLFHDDRYGTIPFGVGCHEIESLMAAIEPKPGQSFICRDFGLSIAATGILLVLNPLPSLPAAFGAAALVVGQGAEARLALLPPLAIRDNLAAAELSLLRRKDGILPGIAALLGSIEGGIPARPVRQVADLWASPSLSRLLRGLRDGEGAEVGEALNRLIGLGTGLTPTMDDLLVGMTYTIAFFGRRCGGIDPRARVLPAIISAGAYRKTTEISGAYLESAASGEVFSLLEAVEFSLFTEGGRQGLESNIAALLKVGSDSGGNMLIGVLLAIPFCLGSINLIYGVSK